MAKKRKTAKLSVKRAVKAVKRVAWSKADDASVRRHSRAKTPVQKIAKEVKRTIGSLRQRAFKLGLGLGHRR